MASHIFRWDLDKTYLRTEFDTFRDLVKSAFEKAIDKHAVPGAPTLMRALRNAGGQKNHIAIVSGSPRQMRKVLQAKLAIDGVEFDELVLKPNLKNLMRGRFRAIKQQIPYKLPALLESRAKVEGPARETLFGDDAESDALIYCLYADILRGVVGRDEVAAVLEAVSAYDDQREQIMAQFDAVIHCDAVARIFIHLDRRSPTARFGRFGARLVPIYNYFQAALVLYSDGRLRAEEVVSVAREMILSGEYELGMLANSLQDLLWRGHLARDVASRLSLEALETPDDADWPEDLPPKSEIAWTFATRVRALGDDPMTPPAVVEPIDYAAAVEDEIVRRRRHRRLRKDAKKKPRWRD